MAPAAESDVGSAKSEEALSFDEGILGVKIAEVPELGGRAAQAARAFKPGECVFIERILVLASATTNVARVRAYCHLCDADRQKLREQFFAEEPELRCAATAACRPDAAGTGDSSVEVLRALRVEGHADLTLDEVEAVIRVWNLNAFDCALAPVACQVNHSCSPNVFVKVDAITSTIQATACRAIAEGEVLGSWYFQDTGLWWMGSDVRKKHFAANRGFHCGCSRCSAPDASRQMPCSACSGGFVIPTCLSAEGQGCVWQCRGCGASSPGDAVRLNSEVELVPHVLRELWPAKDTAKRSSPEELVAMDLEVCQKLGPRHWAAAAAALVLHFRARPGGRLDTFSMACGVRYLGWLIDLGLPPPPAAIVRTPISVMLDCVEWLVRPDVERKTQHDRRCLASRLLVSFLLPVFEASGGAIAQVARTGDRVSRLREWYAHVKSTCGSCQKKLSSSSRAGRCSEDGGDVVQQPDSHEPVAAALSCGRCRQLVYCSKACQKADWKARHKEGCLPSSESLAGDQAWHMLLATAS